MNEEYLGNGALAVQTEYMKDLAKTLRFDAPYVISGDLEYVAHVLEYMTEKLNKQRPEGWIKLFHTRTAEEIIKSGFTTGCTDSAIVFCTIMRAAGIPTKYIETISKRWLDDKENKDPTIRGHAFADVYIDKRWVLVDPDSRRIHLDPNKDWELFEIFGTGLDPHDFGLTSFAKMKGIFYEYREKRNGL